MWSFFLLHWQVTKTCSSFQFVFVCVCGCLSNILIAENSGGSCQAVFVNTTSSSSHCACLENMALFFCCKSRRLQISINVKETGACTSVCIFSTWHGGIHFCSEGELWVPSASAPDTQQKACCPLCLHGRAPVARAATPVQMRPGGMGVHPQLGPRHPLQCPS